MELYQTYALQTSKSIITRTRRSKMATPPDSYSPSSTHRRTHLTTQTSEAEQGACAPTESSSVFQHGLTTTVDQSQYLPQGYDGNEDLYSSLFELTVAQIPPTRSLRPSEMKPQKSSAFVEADKISIPSDHTVWVYVDNAQRAVKAKDHDGVNLWFTALVMELNNIENKYESEHEDVNDIEFPENIIKAFHQIFERITEFELEEIVKKLKREAKERRNFRSYESSFEDFERKIYTRIRELPDRWQACLTEFTENAQDQKLLHQDDIDQVCRLLKEHKGKPDVDVMNLGELQRALVKVGKFDSQKIYTRDQLSRFYKCAERVIRVLSSQDSLSLPEGYTTSAVRELVETVPDIIFRYNESSRGYFKLQDASHKVSKMMIEAFLELRGKPKCGSLLLWKYLTGSTKTSEDLYAALTDLKTTGYWETYCSIEFKKNVRIALDNSTEFQEFKARLDSVCQQELEDDFKQVLTREEMDALFLVQGALGERMVSSQVIRRVVTLLTNIPSQCFAMNNHLFGTSASLRQQNPGNHPDIRDRNEFKLALAIEEEQGLSSINMRFSQKKGRAQLIFCDSLRCKTKLDIWIINPDGRPFQPSPLNGIHVILGPEATVPLAIEGQQTKTTSYNYCTGYEKTSYKNAEDMRLKHVQSVHYPQRKVLTDTAIGQFLSHASDGLQCRFMTLGGTCMLTEEARRPKQGDQNRPSRVPPEQHRSSGQSMHSHSCPAKGEPGQPSVSQHQRAHAQHATVPSKKTDVRPKSTQAKPAAPLEQAAAAGEKSIPPKDDKTISGEGKGRRSAIFNLFSGAKASGKRK